MQKFSYRLKTFVKALEVLTESKGYSSVEMVYKSDSGVRFELFIRGEIVPACFLVVHTEHEAAKRVTSKGDYKKVATLFDISLEEFLEILEEQK